ncbi:mRNA export factor GLE1-like [Corticium candelabrum]|uniref:mRNA export factor GLE1-like n=1 Tax=Corticium candelabrum TaxID=121492 RepID=UPI002E271BFB|nr:mRNA export factor GLE1-like [Corticium candelabrum]
MTTPSVLQSLKTSNKGRLLYDNLWNTSAESTMRTLQQCTSSPPLRTTLALRMQQRSMDITERIVQPESTISRNTSQSMKSTSAPQGGESLSAWVDVGMSRLSYCEGVVLKECLAQERRDEETLQKRVIRRQQYLNGEYKHIQEWAENRLIDAVAKMEEKEEERCANVTRIVDQDAISNQQQRTKSEETMQRRWQEIDEIMKVGEAKRQQITEEERIRAEELRKRLERLEKIKSIQVTICDVETQSKCLLAQCRYKSYLSHDTTLGEIKELEQNVEKSGDLLNVSEKEGPTDMNIEEMVRLESCVRHGLRRIQDLVHQAELAFNEAEAKKKEEEAKAASEARYKEQQEREKKAKEDQKKLVVSGDSTRSVCTLPDQLVNCASPSAYALYEQLKKKLDDVLKLCEPLASPTTVTTKKLKLELQKAIAHPVNAISSQSAAHLRDKVGRLVNLLSGKTVTIADMPINATQHPQGRAFCLEYLAKKLVHKAAQQVSAKHESAFPLAAVATAVWKLYPELGHLLLAHFYIACPYIIPFYMPRNRNQLEGDYMKMLGYLVDDDGKVEEEEQYLKRMSGILRFYAAIIQSTPPGGGQSAHPHGVEHGWVWLSRLVNLSPRQDVTATLLFDFLEVAGHALLEAYGKQFRKLLALIASEYYPKIEKVTPESKRGPLTRLRQFLEDCVKTGRISQPQGYLSSQFWTRAATPPLVDLTSY